IQTQHPTPGGTASVKTTYDGLGHATDVTNPYFSTTDPTYGVTHTDYDALGRVTKVTKQDGSASTVSYDGNCTTATDEAGNPRKGCSDALGRLIEVDEPGTGSLGLPASGSVTINGALQTASGPSAATGSITISGSEKSTQVLTHAATPATVIVSVGGSDGSKT